MASKRTKEILARLDEVYTREYKCYLNYETPEQLLVATMLSAQCTDARVNVVTKDLFQKYRQGRPGRAGTGYQAYGILS